MKSISMQSILERYDPARPLVLIPRAGTGLIDFRQTVFPAEDTVFLSGSRYIVDRFSKENPGVQFMTTHRFRRVRKTQKFACVVLLGACAIGNLRSQTNKSVRLARAAGAAVLCVTSDLGDPAKVYGVAAALGVECRVFGSWLQFRDEYLRVVGGAGFGQQWIAGVKKDMLEALADKVKTFTDRRLVEGVG